MVVLLENPIKSLADHNSYRAIRLANGLQALLISVGDESNREEGFCGASMAVGAGSLDFGLKKEIKNIAILLIILKSASIKQRK